MPTHNPAENRILEIPYGIGVLPAEDLARWITSQTVQIPDDEMILAVIKKGVPAGKGEWLIEELTQADWNLVKHIWNRSPLNRFPLTPCTKKQFEEEFIEAFESAANKPLWRLWPEYKWNDKVLSAQEKWRQAHNAHLAQIAEAIHKRGKTLLTKEGFPTDCIESAFFIRVQDAAAYLEDIGMELREVSDASFVPPATEAQPDTGRDDEETTKLPWQLTNNERNFATADDLAKAFKVKAAEEANIKWWKETTGNATNGKRYKWLAGACEDRGSPGKFASKWNPAAVADALVKKWPLRRPATISALNKYFAEWVDDFTLLNDDKRSPTA